MKYLLFIAAIIFPHSLSLVAFDQFIGNQYVLVAIGIIIDVIIYAVIYLKLKRK